MRASARECGHACVPVCLCALRRMLHLYVCVHAPACACVYARACVHDLGAPMDHALYMYTNFLILTCALQMIGACRFQEYPHRADDNNNNYYHHNNNNNNNNNNICMYMCILYIYIYIYYVYTYTYIYIYIHIIQEEPRRPHLGYQEGPSRDRAVIRY